jgi:YD repeat-containing protein
MKTPILLFACSILFLGFTFPAAESVFVDFDCKKTAKITKQTLGSIPMVIEYQSGKISKVYRGDGKGLVENYTYQSATDLLITRNFKDGGVGNTFHVTLNAQGYVTEIVQPEAYRFVYTYDSTGYLTGRKMNYEGDTSYNSTSTYAYKGGNLVQEKTVMAKALSYTVDYTYYENLPNKADLIGNQNRPDLYGKYSKNLTKSSKTTYTDLTTEQYDYTYERNAHGFVKAMTEKYTDQKGKVTASKNLYEYVCL